MSITEEILNDTSHRPFEIPKGKWSYYQEWNRVIFLHWKVSYEFLRACVPHDLTLDHFDGEYYVSLVAFTMEEIRPRLLPAIDFISDFDEINIRTYIDNDHRKGVYFLSIEAGKQIPVLVARLISGLPYEKANISRETKSYISENATRGFRLSAGFEVNNESVVKTELDKWLTERYCLYFDLNNELYRYDIHHKEWELKKLQIRNLNLNYKIGDIYLSGNEPDLTHYSDGVKVLAWERKKI
jgi:uncharacterized protein